MVVLLCSWVLYFSDKTKRSFLQLGYESPGLFSPQGSTLYKDVVKEASLTGSTSFLPSSLRCGSSHRPLGSVPDLRFELSGLRQGKVSVFGSQRSHRQVACAKLPFTSSFGFLSLLNVAVLLTAVKEHPAIYPEGVCQPHLALPNLAIMYLHHEQGHPVIFMAPLSSGALPLKHNCTLSVFQLLFYPGLLMSCL